MSQVRRRSLLVSRAGRGANVGIFSSVETSRAYGEVRVCNHFVSIGPCMRKQMNAGKSYFAMRPLAGQLAGCRVPGIAGGADKCRYIVDPLGFDVCVDYKAGRLADDFSAVVPDGVDGYFQKVGGAVLDATLALMNPFGRIAMCGMIAV
ncbi:zinc-binding dehydrogenase family protein [Burkholderia sp. ABCPW 111]|nr:zinc-binding dehydrogenase family protein [Burkholderia sp. ABCPW 111]